MFVWSSNTRRIIDLVLKNYRIQDKFEKIVTRLDVDLLKPRVDGFCKIYDAKIPKNRYLIIGDSQHDREAARKAGVDFFPVDIS